MAHDYIRALARDSEAFVCSLDRHPLLGSVISGEAAQPEYVSYLVASYHYVRWSGLLLAKTAQGLRRSGRCPALLAAVDNKAVEEGPHDQWLLRDLKSCGVDPELVKRAPAPSAVRAYTELSVTLAEAGSPAFLGAAYTLEFISMRRASMASKNLRARMAIPRIGQALRFLEGHGEADHGHIAELEALLEFVEDEADQADIAFSSGVMRRLYPRLFSVESWLGAMEFHCVVAQNEPQIADAERVRFKVYCEEERMLPPAAGSGGRESDGYDFADATVHLLVYAGDQPVGTVRLILARARSAVSSHPLGLALETNFTLGGFKLPEIRLAEVTRFLRTAKLSRHAGHESFVQRPAARKPSPRRQPLGRRSQHGD